MAKVDVRLVGLFVFGVSLVIAEPPLPGLAAGKIGAVASHSVLASANSKTAPTISSETSTLSDVDELVTAAIADARLPGCVVAFGRHDRVLFQKAYGLRE